MSKTFSEIVDIVTVQSGYQSNISLVVTAVNRAIKLCMPYKHFSQLKEIRYQIENKRGFNKNLSHCLPLPQDLRIPLSVRADNHRFIVKKNPGIGQVYQPNPIYYYLAGSDINIRCYIKSHVDMAYYAVVKDFLYYPPEKRLVKSTDIDAEFLFEYRHPQSDDWLPFNSLDPNQEKSYNRHINWLTKDYSEVLVTGALSSVLNAKGSIEAGGRLYQQFLEDVRDLKAVNSETRIGEQ